MAAKPDPENWQVEVVRSTKRKRTVSAEVRNGVLVVRAPSRMTDAELAPHIEILRRRLSKQAARQRLIPSDKELQSLARELNREFFSGALEWQSIHFVTNMQKRFGSCSPAQGAIRISDRLAKMPKWVLRYVVMHEMAHLKEANHSPKFWALLERYPLAERARGYLMGVGFKENGDYEVD